MQKFSVSMCVYAGDSSPFFREAVRSVLEQSLPPSELVVVADGPLTPDLEAVIADTSQDYPSVLRLVRFEENKGHGEARRAGLEACSHELVALMDADDVSLPRRFEKQLQLFEANPDVSVVGGALEEFTEVDGAQVGQSVRRLPETDREIRELLKWRCPMNQPTVMFKKSAVIAAGGYVDWYCNEDYYLWIRMALNGAVFANLSDVILRFRVDEGTYDRRGGMRYFRSEARLQYFMYKNGLSGMFVLAWNVIIRFAAQVLCPPKVRAFLYTRIFRNRVEASGQDS